MSFSTAKGGKPFPTKVVKDVGSPSTLRNNPDVKTGATKKSKSMKRRK